eukprot:TRINITY_DN4638_c0_g3_i3.p1 TRINITY_DN4638_c0_g3~~TRINITY_DN4638_c0_g3_i3.p1  ORF type:complete len:309 (+),score=72.83 TRINITY_DN4638_c0_g3_i3:550-1476(+)
MEAMDPRRFKKMKQARAKRVLQEHRVSQLSVLLAHNAFDGDNELAERLEKILYTQCTVAERLSLMELAVGSKRTLPDATRQQLNAGAARHIQALWRGALVRWKPVHSLANWAPVEWRMRPVIISPRDSEDGKGVHLPPIHGQGPETVSMAAYTAVRNPNKTNSVVQAPPEESVEEEESKFTHYEIKITSAPEAPSLSPRVRGMSYLRQKRLDTPGGDAVKIVPTTQEAPAAGRRDHKGAFICTDKRATATSQISRLNPKKLSRRYNAHLYCSPPKGPEPKPLACGARRRSPVATVDYLNREGNLNWGV